MMDLVNHRVEDGPRIGGQPRWWRVCLGDLTVLDFLPSVRIAMHLAMAMDREQAHS